jgi:hypothetical protein
MMLELRCSSLDDGYVELKKLETLSGALDIIVSIFDGAEVGVKTVTQSQTKRHKTSDAAGSRQWVAHLYKTGFLMENVYPEERAGYLFLMFCVLEPDFTLAMLFLLSIVTDDSNRTVTSLFIQ